MSKDPENENPGSSSQIEAFFEEAVHDSLHGKLGLRGFEDVESYLAQMLKLFLHFESIYAIRDAQGRRVLTVPEMLAEGDVLLNAESFERERAVHKHIGDFLLFWSGLFPEFLERTGGTGNLEDAVRQGKVSYYIVSSFDYVPYDAEAPTFRKLSEAFELCREGLLLVRRQLRGLPEPD